MGKINKYYREAYNNPERMSKIEIKETSDEKLLKYYENISRGITDAFKDRENNTYKYK